MILTEWLTEARRLALRVAPELRQAPLYIVQAPEGCPMPYGFTAECQRSNALHRQLLIASGLWEGPGAVITLGDFEVLEEWESLAGLVLHEIAHALPYAPPEPDREPSAEELARDRRLLEALA